MGIYGADRDECICPLNYAMIATPALLGRIRNELAGAASACRLGVDWLAPEHGRAHVSEVSPVPRSQKVLMDVASLCPGVNAWMNSAPKAHPLWEIIDNVTASREPSSVGLDILAALEDIIVTLEQADPQRLATERADFQKARNFNDLLIVRAELVAAAKLARAGVPFEFGSRKGSPQPDLVLKNCNLAIEVKNRKLDGLRDLATELNTALIEAKAAVTVHLGTDEWVLCIKASERKDIIDQTLQRVATGAVDGFSIVLDHPWATAAKPSVRVQIFPHPPLVESQRVSIQNAFVTTGHFTDIENEIVAVLTSDVQKGAQAQSIPTVLLIDIGRTGMSWIRPERIWAAMLAARIPATTPFVGVAVMIPRITDRDVVISLALRNNISEQERTAAESLTELLRLTRDGDVWYG